MKKIRRPALKFFGSKWTLSNWLIEHFPAHNHYIEPCFGSGAILLNKKPVKVETVNDINGRITNFFSNLRDNRDDLIELINLTPWSEDEYETCKIESDNSVEDARRFFVSCWMSINGGPMFTGFRVMHKASHRYSPVVNDINNHDLLNIAKRLKNVQITNRDALDVIAKFGKDKDSLIYFDPPYVKSTRKFRQGYGNNEVEIDFHIAAGEKLSSCNAKVVVSGFRSELYDNIYDGWTRIDKTGSFASLNKLRTESIWIKN